MKTEAYAQRLRAQDVPEERITRHLAVIARFIDGLRDRNVELASATPEDIRRYAAHMIEEGWNTPENYDILAGYTLWLGLRPVYVALAEISDCYNAMHKLADVIEARHGADIRKQIFSESPPPLGADESERLAYTQQITARMDAVLSQSAVRAAWFQVQHGIPDAAWEAEDAREKKQYADCTSLDAFLQLKREKRNAAIIRMHEENRLWYTQEVTGDVMRFFTQEHHLQMGAHKGRRGIIVSKIPYQADAYLRETDDRKKRYYACHCPMIREAILRGEAVSESVCYCSLGHASHFLAGMGLEHLEGEVLESAAQGDERCRFIFYLPVETGV